MKPNPIKTKQIVAPCGINCSLCLAFQRDKNSCCGCWGPDDQKPLSCVHCIIKNCEYLAATQSKFCYECIKYPCARIKQLNKRYSTKYNVSIADNQQTIKNRGLEAFILQDTEKWKCPQCGGSICMHRGFCLKCNQK